MNQEDDLLQENQALRERLSRLSEASVRVNESLDFNVVLQEVIDSACYLTNARYGVIAGMNEVGGLDSVLTSGTTEDEHRQLVELPGGTRIFDHFSKIPGPFRVDNYYEFAESVGLDGWLPMTVFAGLAAPVRHRGEPVGIIWLGHDREGVEFTNEDEETLVMFASQAATVIAISSRYRDEQRARADLETLIDTSPVGVVVFDMSTGAPASFNREVRRIADGLRDSDETPEMLLELLTVRRADGSEISLREYPIAEALSKSQTVRAEEIVMEAPGGRSITVLLNATPIRSEEGELESVVVTLQDMTPLEEMERLRAEFLGMVSHELRTPLTSIRGSATSMLDATEDLDPAETRQFLRIIVDQADSMRDMIGDLLDVARIETGTLPVNPEPANVAALVDRARNNFLSAGGRNNLDIDLSPDLPLVMADRRRIVQVIGNLLSNAARHSPESSVIRVSAVRDGAHVELSVVDEGRGIPTEQLPHLFRRFSQREDDDPGGDTGLGLAICKGIVEAHGGRIRAESDGPGLGTRFAFTVPAADEAPAEPYRPTESLRIPGQEQVQGEPILVLDDDPETLRYVRKALSEAGYSVIVTADPEEAVPLMEETRPHLVLLDLMLPGADGITLMQDILGVSDVPVIFISVYGRDRVVARAFEAGAIDYIVKPFSPTELVARVRAALRRVAGHYQPEPSEPYVLGDLVIDYPSAGSRLPAARWS